MAIKLRWCKFLQVGLQVEAGYALDIDLERMPDIGKMFLFSFPEKFFKRKNRLTQIFKLKLLKNVKHFFKDKTVKLKYTDQ